MSLVNIYLWLTSHLNLIESQNVEHMIWSWLLYHPMYTICSLKIKKSKWFNWELNCWTQARMFDLKAKWNNHNYGWWKKFLVKLNQINLGINCELTCVPITIHFQTPKIWVEFRIWGCNVGHLACSNRTIKG